MRLLANNVDSSVGLALIFTSVALPRLGSEKPLGLAKPEVPFSGWQSGSRT
jgi:hypothetical protein